MEAKDLHRNAPKNLLDKIASDPEIINRGAAEPAPEVVTPVVPAVPVAASTGVQNQASSEGNVAPVINLFKPNELGMEPPPVVAAAPVVSVVTKPRSKAGLVVGCVAIMVLIGGGAAAYAVFGRPAPEPVAQATPTATPIQTPTLSPSASPTPTPTPTPAPVQNTVTAPAAAPTVERPQAVTVKSKSGLWLRSSPNSSNQDNVIGWIPYNGQVSVDNAGDFWWHGTYAGKPGYFAVNYTK